MDPEVIPARQLSVGWYLRDTSLPGTHGQRIEIQWVGHHDRRQRTYVAGVEEQSRNPVQLAYDNTKQVKVWKQ